MYTNFKKKKCYEIPISIEYVYNVKYNKKDISISMEISSPSQIYFSLSLFYTFNYLCWILGKFVLCSNLRKKHWYLSWHVWRNIRLNIKILNLTVQKINHKYNLGDLLWWFNSSNKFWNLLCIYYLILSQYIYIKFYCCRSRQY